MLEQYVVSANWSVYERLYHSYTVFDMFSTFPEVFNTRTWEKSSKDATSKGIAH